MKKAFTVNTCTTAKIFCYVALMTHVEVSGFASLSPTTEMLQSPSTITRQQPSRIIVNTRSNQQKRKSDSNTALQAIMSSPDEMMNFENVLYNAQSMASNLASISLDDDSSVLMALPVMYGAGLLTSVSPCVWGLLPLTISYISTAAGEREDKQTTLPTIAFAGGLASVFCSLGVAVSLFGGVFGSSGSAGGNGSISMVLPILSNLICLTMGFQLLDFIQLPRLPSLQGIASNNNIGGNNNNNEEELLILDGSGQLLLSKKEEDVSSSSSGGSLFRTFLLGGSSALVASPCATPVLTSILAYVASAQNPILGAALLLIYTLGYSTPLLYVASKGGQALIDLRQMGNDSDKNIYSQIAPWITPLTGGILLWYGTDGLLTSLFGDPSLMGLPMIIE